MNDTTKQRHDKHAWVKEPWVWVILAPLIASIVLSTIMVTVAVRGADDVVVDDYYKQGRMLAQETHSEAYARSLGLSANLTVDNVSGEVMLSLNQGVNLDRLELLISHPAEAEFDKTLELKQISSRRYRADLQEALEGRWYLRLTGMQAGEKLWRMHGDLDLSKANLAELE